MQTHVKQNAHFKKLLTSRAFVPLDDLGTDVGSSLEMAACVSLVTVSVANLIGKNISTENFINVVNLLSNKHEQMCHAYCLIEVENSRVWKKN